MHKVTILTPTYNRCQELKNLYGSLLNQTCKDFEWLVVDDGSGDSTMDYLEELVHESPIDIRYIFKENGGKHTALNRGVKEITTEWTIIVDSDDQLFEGAVEDIIAYGEKYAKNDKISAMSFLRADAEGKVTLGLEKEEFQANYIRYRIKENRPGDMAEVFKTEILKKYPFPEFEHERFLSEDVVWIEMGKDYDYAFINKPIYMCEYLEGGLTDSDKKMKFNSPFGSMLRGKQLMNRKCGLKNRLKGAIIYNCYKIAAKGQIPDSVKTSNPFTFITKPLGRVYYKKWKPNE